MIEYENIRKETKKQKRRVNIEIASGVIDLILDMADEVYDTTVNQPGRKLTKGQWREFSNLFIDGKKCSLRNIKKPILDADGVRSSQSEGRLVIPTNQSASILTSSFVTEPALHDLYQFISNLQALQKNLSQKLFLQNDIE